MPSTLVLPRGFFVVGFFLEEFLGTTFFARALVVLRDGFFGCLIRRCFECQQDLAVGSGLGHGERCRETGANVPDSCRYGQIGSEGEVAHPGVVGALGTVGGLALFKNGKLLIENS